MFTVSQIKDHLIGMGHGGTLNKVRNPEAMMERSASKFLLLCHPVESMRTAALSAFVHDDLGSYSLASDFGSLIDLYPAGDRGLWDRAFRDRAGRFDREKAVRDRTISIEGSEGSKVIKINWKGTPSAVLNKADSLTANGAWALLGLNAANLFLDTAVKYSGVASVGFDVAQFPSSDEGVGFTGASPIDVSNLENVGDILVPVYLGSDYAGLVSATMKWGNDLTTNYFQSSQITTQADGTAFRQGWNIVRATWLGSSEHGSVDSSRITAWGITFSVEESFLTNVRVDNVLFSSGKSFDHKYYSKYLFKSAATGAWISRPTSDDDFVLVDNDTLPLYLSELLRDMAHQMEGTDSAFDINFAMQDLQRLYPAYKGAYPSQALKARGKISGSPGRGRW